MLYSSGTTGRPKGVRRLTTGQPYGTENPVGPLLAGVMGFPPGGVYLTPAPLYHSAPLVWSMTVHRIGGTLVLMEHFDAAACLEAIVDSAPPVADASKPAAKRDGRMRIGYLRDGE